MMGKTLDAKIAKTMLQQKTIFWVPGVIWAEWATSSSSNRFEWIVQVVGQRLDDNGITVLMIRDLHRDEFHSHGHPRPLAALWRRRSGRHSAASGQDINVTSPGKEISLRRIKGLKREALMISLSGAELGKLAEGGFRPSQALSNYDNVGSSSRVNQIVVPSSDPIICEPKAILDLAEIQFSFEKDFRASRVT